MCRHGLFSCGSLELCKVWWLCLPLSCDFARYGGCVCLCHAVVQGMMAVFCLCRAVVQGMMAVFCLCRAVVQGMMAVFAFVMRLYKV